MRIILSRKGYDSASGGIPSPIFPDGALCSLPIPSTDTAHLKDVRFQGRPLDAIVEQLAGPDVAGRGVHLDPDLDFDARLRQPGWLPCFGQVGASQAHLARRSIGPDDLFLFFGWFREVEMDNGGLRYRRDAPDIHCLFGWLQVGAIYRLGMAEASPPQWASDHPHVSGAERYLSEGANNALYVASERLRLPGLRRPVSGGGAFRHFDPRLQLTAPGRKRSIWRLPASFRPKTGLPPLSYHSDARRWSEDADGILLQLVGRGQEFVLDCDCYPDVYDWLEDLAAAALSSARTCTGLVQSAWPDPTARSEPKPADSPGRIALQVSASRPQPRPRAPSGLRYRLIPSTYPVTPQGATRMSITKTRGLLYLIARLLGDVSAVQKGTVGKRLARRVAGKLTGRGLGKLFR